MNTEQENAFTAVNEAIKKATALNHFKRICPLRITCDASKSGLGAVLQQEEKGTWKPISFASRFLTELEFKVFDKRIRTTRHSMVSRIFQELRLWSPI